MQHEVNQVDINWKALRAPPPNPPVSPPDQAVLKRGDPGPQEGKVTGASSVPPPAICSATVAGGKVYPGRVLLVNDWQQPGSLHETWDRSRDIFFLFLFFASESRICWRYIWIFFPLHKPPPGRLLPTEISTWCFLYAASVFRSVWCRRLNLWLLCYTLKQEVTLFVGALTDLQFIDVFFWWLALEMEEIVQDV